MKQWIVEKEFRFSAAHRLPFHPGKCSNIHGHTWRVIVAIDAARLNDQSMVMDFGDISEIVGTYLDQTFDHALIVDKDDVLRPFYEDLESCEQKVVYLDGPPTAENLAKIIYDEVYRRLVAGIAYVDVYESPTAKVRYSDD